MNEPKSFVVMDNARVEKQRELMEAARAKGVCPFCPDGETEIELEPAIRTGDWWTVRNNRFPLKSTSLHLIFISKTHAEKLADLDPDARYELMELMLWAEREYELASGALAMRFGDPSGNGATIRHLHAHLIVADRDTSREGYEDVRFRMGPKSKK